ncbi:hypothetical protein E2320_003094 [Naja naja]|nr:hypothetical protein E2320_003094 [Naja naja]
MWLAHTDFYYDCICALPPPTPFVFKEAVNSSLVSSGAHLKETSQRYFIIRTQPYKKFPKLVCAAVGLIALLPSIKIETTIPVVQDSVGGGLPALLGL